jgi:hypothetical protein
MDNLKIIVWHKERQQYFDLLAITLSDLNGRVKQAEINNGAVTIWVSLDQIEFVGLTTINQEEINNEK